MQEEQGDLYLPSPSSHKRHGCRYNLPATEVILVKDWPKKSGVTKEKTTAADESEYNLYSLPGPNELLGQILVSTVRKEPAGLC